MLGRVSSRALLRVSHSRLMSASPKITIAQNILALRGVAAATDAASLAAATKVDISKIPEDIQWLSAYTSASATGEGASGFKQDPSAWQNKEFSAFVVEESSRHDMWPFAVCGLITYLLLGVIIPLSYPNSARKNSKYISMLEGRRGKMEHEHGGDAHGHDAHAAAHH